MWSKKNVDEVLTELGTNIETGLSQSAYEQSLTKNGPNKLPEEGRKSPIVIFFKNFLEPLVIVLLLAAAISLFVGEAKEAIVIVIIVVINAIIGTVQEVRSQKSLDALKQLSTPQVTVRRNGETVEVDSTSLVPGDIVVLDAGKFIPADLRIVESAQLQIDESALTGESVPVDKKSAAITDEGNIALGDQINMAFMSTFITNGRAVGVVIGTGLNTEIGKIASMISEAPDTKTPLQEKLAQLTKVVSILAFVLGGIILGLEIFMGNVVGEALISAITLAVAVIPESLPVIVSIVLAISVSRMVKHHAIIKKLPAVETLGAVNVICSDKTGTLTQNKMTVVKYLLNNKTYEPDKFDLNDTTHEIFLRSLELCNDSFFNDDEQPIGDPTEVALTAFASLQGWNEFTIRKEFPRVDEQPFDSDRKLMTTVNQHKDQFVVYTKGATDQLLERCSKIILDGTVVSMTDGFKAEIMAQANKMSEDALRVLGFAYKEISALDPESDYEHDLTFIGCVGMIDPARPEAASAIARAAKASIETVMITGDHRVTAFAIAKNLGIVDNENEVISGSELDEMDDVQLAKVIRNYHVFARVSPEHKVRIVKALQSHGLIVSMTGDGVNDAPSLQTADIGVAMGITGTDVSKEAADMILTDDNFATIVGAVEEGRNIYKKIRRAIAFVLSTNLGEVLAVFIAVIVSGYQPLSAVHILWVNLIVESIIAIPMGMDVNDPDVMNDTPRPRNESLFTNMVFRILFVAFTTMAAVLIAYFIGLQDPNDTIANAQTMAFLVMATAPMLTSLSMRSEKWVFFTKSMFANRNLIIAIIAGITLNFLAVFTPLSSFLGLVPLEVNETIITVSLMVIPALMLELSKIFIKHKR